MSEVLPYVEVDPAQPCDAVVIWLHGLGDSGNGFAPIVPALNLPTNSAVRFIFPHAPVRPVTINNGMPMRAWYDIQSLDFNNRADVQGVEESAAAVKQLIGQEMAKGIPSERIVLAGFSQGGVIAYQLGLGFDHPLAGILCLSTYISQPESLDDRLNEANKKTPIMVMHGEQDDVVPQFLGHGAYQQLQKLGYNIDWKSYPMQHNVCPAQLGDISNWLQSRLPVTA